jgi:hypothetical protein
MHEIEPFYNWEESYSSAEDPRSPFYEAEYNTEYYTNSIYGYYIHPLWDYIGSETLYIKILFADYDEQVVVIEFLGEWNDTLHNDVMHLKRNVIDLLLAEGITKYILIGENIMNFHGSDDEYYAEWFEEIEDGWIAGINFRDHVLEEWKKFNLDYYINFGGTLEVLNWRTMNPQTFCKTVEGLIQKRLG